MDSAFPFVSSSDRSKYIELCQALSNLNGSNANPDFEDRVEIRTQLKKVVTEEALPDNYRKPVSRAKSHSNGNQPKRSNLQAGNKQIQEVVPKRSATPRAPGDQKKRKSVMNDQKAMQPVKFLQNSQARTQHSVKGKQVL